MAESKKVTKSSNRGYKISQWQELLYDDYMHFHKTGEQCGVFNLIGPAGIGKTEGIYQLAEKIQKNINKECKVIELYLSALIDPESAAGTPVPVTETDPHGKKWQILRMFHREELVDAAMNHPKSILFIDEMGREADQLRPMIMKLLHEKKIGGFDLRNFYLVVAGNPSDEEHNVVAIQEDAAISSRLCDIPCKADVEEAAQYFYNFTASHKAVADFLLENQQYMFGRDSEGEQHTKFHNPRAWFNAAHKLHFLCGGTTEEPGNIKSGRAAMVLTGMIGSHSYQALKTFMSTDRALTVKQILTGQFKAPLRQVPPSTEMALKTYIKTKQLKPAEADNLTKFLDAIMADKARSIMREAAAGNILPANNRLLVAKGVFRKWIQRIGTENQEQEEQSQEEQVLSEV